MKTKLDPLFIPRIPSTELPLKTICTSLPYVSEFSNREVKFELTQLMHRFIPSQILSLFKKTIFPFATFYPISYVAVFTNSRVCYKMPLTVRSQYVTYRHESQSIGIFCPELVFHYKNLMDGFLIMPLQQVMRQLKIIFQLFIGLNLPSQKLLKVQ